MLLDQPHALDQHALLARDHFEDLPGRTTKVPRDDLDVVALSDVHFDAIHKTSGARETIFIKFRSRNSRATGPKMRVPRGLFALSMITAAFSSNAIDVPSSRPYGLCVRTTTAWTTSPFLIAPCGVAVFTVAVITSPTRA